MLSAWYPDDPSAAEDCYYTILVALSNDPEAAGGTEFMDTPFEISDGATGASEKRSGVLNL